jgi:hypothetical protein
MDDDAVVRNAKQPGKYPMPILSQAREVKSNAMRKDHSTWWYPPAFEADIFKMILKHEVECYLALTLMAYLNLRSL